MHFQKCKQLFEYQHLLLETSGGKSYDLYLNVVRFFQHHCQLDICGSFRQLFSRIGV
jgi:hypothetical protein